MNDCAIFSNMIDFNIISPIKIFKYIIYVHFIS